MSDSDGAPHIGHGRSSSWHEKTYNALNRERIREYKREWVKKNKDKVKDQQKRWREANAEQLKKKKAEYYRTGYYNNKLVQKFNVMRGEILMGNDGQELLDEFKELIFEMHKREILDDETASHIMAAANFT